MELSVPDASFLDSFEKLGCFKLGEYEKNELNLFMIRVNSNEFNYELLIRNLLEPIITYSVSRKVKEEYSNRPHELVKKAINHFVLNSNAGELGELLLYAFLECHLKAPKILTKLELKTSNKMYVHGADGVHFLKLPNENYQLIFGESKTIDNLTDALRKAFTSIEEFKKQTHKDGKPKSGIEYEKALISDNLEKEAFSEEDLDLIQSLIYPRKENTFLVDDAFGVFIGYNIDISPDDKKLPNDSFHKKISELIINTVKNEIPIINKYIVEKDLTGHSFYIYILPFTDLGETRKKILKELTST